MKRKIFDSC